MDLRLDAHSSYVQYKVQICCSCNMFFDVNFMYRLYHDSARTLKRSLSGKLAIVELSDDFGFARNSSKHPCTLASFSRACMPRSACTSDATCELYCICDILNTTFIATTAQLLFDIYIYI